MSRNLVPVEARICARCKASFQPKVGGYNALYCSGSCKASARIRPPYDESKRIYNREYVRSRMKLDPIFKADHNAKSEKYRKSTREWLAEYKMAHGCVDCGYRVHFSALQLDHEGTKSIEIANARSSIARLKAEIEAGQCKVRCANCHSIKTWERKQPANDNGSSEVQP